MKKVALKLHRLTPDEMITLGREIVDKITASGDVFATPAVPMATMTNAITALQDAQQATLLGGKAATIHRNQMRKVLEALLKEQAVYVELTAKGDPDIITLAGMTPQQRGPRRYETIGTPINLRAYAERTGEVRLSWKKVAYARSYVVEYCLNPGTDDGWIHSGYNTSAAAHVGGLPRGREYSFRVCAIGTQGLTSNWSDAATQMVL